MNENENSKPPAPTPTQKPSPRQPTHDIRWKFDGVDVLDPNIPEAEKEAAMERALRPGREKLMAKLAQYEAERLGKK